MLEEIVKEISDIKILELKPLNSGGQKQVYLTKLEKDICLLKIVPLFPSYLDINNYDDDAILEIEEQVEARLKRELKLMNLCSDRFPKTKYIESYKKIVFNDKKYAFYFEEYINGKDLDLVMKEKGKYNLFEIISFLKSMIINLKCMYAYEIVHRDIKPKNIIVKDEDYFLIDLGLCRQTYEDETLTVSFQTLGTKSYMSPEQRKGVKTDYKWDFRNDLYAIGLIITEMFLPDMRKIRYENIYLPALKQLWYATSTNKNETKFFDSVIIRLLAIERFARFKTIEDIEIAVNALEEVM